ncbi:hypothetical protein KSP40_PGU007983 [Platanthera guangdongensis]|uniref:Uncharacterized protein n=1 Tax=Platanthera guangdongensis TaxID=2320717 RepID=A0ABR2LX75_9ASPA
MGLASAESGGGVVSTHEEAAVSLQERKPDSIGDTDDGHWKVSNLGGACSMELALATSSQPRACVGLACPQSPAACRAL